MHQTAGVVSLWCIKTDISSLQINYQLSPRPASVISLSGSRSDGLHCVLSLPPHRLTAISSSAVVFQLVIHARTTTTTTTTLTPSRCVGERGWTCETITPRIGFVSGRIKSCSIMKHAQRKRLPRETLWHNVAVKPLVEYQRVQMKR